MRANPKLYEELGLKNVTILDVEDTVALMQPNTGALGEAICAHLQAAGLQTATRDECRSAVKSSLTAVKTGVITIEHPKKVGRNLSAGWLHVCDVARVLDCVIVRLLG